MKSIKEKVAKTVKGSGVGRIEGSSTWQDVPVIWEIFTDLGGLGPSQESIWA